VRAREEIERHHRVIERWLAGAADAAEFGVFAGAHAESFTLAGPDGRTLTREQVLAEVRAAHGKAPGLAIEIRHVREVAVAGPLLVAAYEEWQQRRDRLATEEWQQRRGRLATVVLRQDQGGLSWLHLQETWIEPPEPP
jgi:hypothetical protein